MRHSKVSWPLLAVAVAFASGLAACHRAKGDEPGPAGTVPVNAQGRPLNLGFEMGTLADWTAEGGAFKGQPIKGDSIHLRRGDMRSAHEGRFWVGTFENGGDEVKGRLTSVPFRVSKPFASFLVGGGSREATYVELVRSDTHQVLFRASGDNCEDMERVVADLSAHQGKEIVIRLVDEDSGGWGHINFDDFRFHDAKPTVPPWRRPPSMDVYIHDGLGPEDAARAMTVPPGFTVSLFAGEPDIVQPIAMAIDDRGRLWVAEAYSYPRRVPANEAKDRILIFEDTDGDGRFDKRKVFADHLNLVSGLEVGFGGAWVGAAPHLLFIPDVDGDDRPDGPPQVVLDGWGLHDTHETLNSFIWGPDGWLYGCHGVFTHSNVGKPGAADRDRVPINAGIWRFHPTSRIFEVFAHGTSNPWGIDFDARGQMVITACVIPHLYHMIHGGRYERQAGQHFNPYTYDDIKTIADHRHYLGANPHGGNGRSNSAGGGHAHSGAMIYQGGAWPAEYNGSLFMNNIHGARINRDILTAKGSGMVGSHAPDFLLANDRWSQIVSLKYGPEGSLYMIDWYDKNQCHLNEANSHDRTNGRIFKVSFGKPKRVEIDLAKETTEALVLEQTSPNEWHARHARRVLQERGPSASAGRMLKELDLKNATQPAIRLRILLSEHAVGGLTDRAEIERRLADPDATIRAWTIQLVTEQQGDGHLARQERGAALDGDGHLARQERGAALDGDGHLARQERGAGPFDAAILSKFKELARSDPSPLVRLYLASALQNLPPENRWETLAGLVSHAEDAGDHNLPLMYWYAAEPLAALDSSRAVQLGFSARIPRIQEFMARRIGALGTTESLSLLVEELGRAGGSARRSTLLIGIEEGLRGRRQVAMPTAWPKVYKALEADTEPDVRSRAVALGLTFGDPAARSALQKVLSDDKAEAGQREQALQALLKAKDPTLPATLHGLVRHPRLGGAAVRGLSAYDDPETPEVLVEAYPSLGPAQRRDALNSLAARKGSSRALLAAVEAGRLPRTDLTADLVRQIRNLKDPDLDTRLVRVWGTIRETTGDRARLIARYKAMLTAKPARAQDRSQGRATYAKVCQQCHTLFGVGGQVGPDLTGSNRADLDYVLSNALDPSALIGKDYLAHVIAMADGRVLTGIVRAEDKDTITLVTANETVTIPKSEIEERRASEQSMMPDDLWNPLSDQEIRALVAYLSSPAQVPMPAGQGEEKTP